MRNYAILGAVAAGGRGANNTFRLQIAISQKLLQRCTWNFEML